MLINTFVMCPSGTSVEEVDERTSKYSSSLDLSGKKYDNYVNICKFVRTEKDEEIEKLEVNAQFISAIKTMVSQCGNLYFIDTLNEEAVLVEEMEKLGFYFYGFVFLTINSYKEEFMQYVML